jgi:Ca-activated chloride channel family protein
VDTNLVLIPVTVCDPAGRPVVGLEKENFRLFDDRLQQAITTFSTDDQPVAVGLVFDTSSSMGAKLHRSRAAAQEFFKLANPEDEFLMVEFSDRPRLVVPLTSNPGPIENQLIFTKSKGSTALIDAVFLAAQQLRKSNKEQKALLLVTDGGDNNSRYTAKELIDFLRESEVQVYAIGVYELPGARGTVEEMNGPGLLRNISELNGGRAFSAEAAELPDIATKIGVELRNRYVLGYSPSAAPRDGKYHTVEVRVAPPRGLPPLHSHWRRGYYAPAN